MIRKVAPKIIILLLVITVGIIIYNMPNEKEEPTQTSFYDYDKLSVKNGFMTYDDDKYTSKVGIDISSHNGSIDFNQVKNAGIEFVYIRCGYRGYSEGVLHVDDYYYQNIENALQAGLEVGVYFFSQATSEQEAIEEANFVHNLIADYKISLPVCYDLEPVNNEGGRIKDLKRSDKTALTIAFNQTIENFGYQAMVYGNADWLYNNLNYGKIDHYNIWYAGYVDKPLIDSKFLIWQYSNAGQIPGISTNVDMNIYFLAK